MGVCQRGLSLSVLCALILAGVSLRGQTISGTLAGTVTDQQGGILSGVGVTATNPLTGLAYEGVTDDKRGYYAIPEVPPGFYEVRADFSGFRPEEHLLVRVDVNRVTREDFTMRLIPPTTVVTAHSNAPMTEIDSASHTTYFDQNQILGLPLLTRDVNDLALLAPGVSSVTTFSFTSTLVPFSVNGSRGRDNNFIIDSVNNNEPLFGGAATQFTNPDIFSEYAIITAEPKAEFGRNTGATVNVITKSGSNEVHGSAFWFGQDNLYNALTQVEKAALLHAPPPFYENKGGATLGGPFRKDKAFFFVSYQWDGAHADLSNVFPVVATLPTPAGLTTLKGLPSTPALNALLSDASVNSIPTQASRCFATVPPPPKANPNGTIPPSPSTTNPCFMTGTSVPNPFGVNYGSYLVPNGNVFDVRDQQASLRIDDKLSVSHSLYGRYLIDDLRTPQSILDPAGEVAFSDLGLMPDGQTLMRQRTQSLLIDERYARTNALNEFRAAFSRIAQGQGAFNLPAAVRDSRPAATITDNFGGFGAYSGNFPSAGTLFTLGQDTSPALTHSNVYQAQDNYSLSRGRHTLKFGADVVRTETNVLDVPSNLGHYFFGFFGEDNPGSKLPGGLQSFVQEPSPGSTNALGVFQAFPDVLTDSSGKITGQGQNELPLREFDSAYFAQDDFRLRPNFTLSGGFRLDQFGQPINGIHHLNPAAPLVKGRMLFPSPRAGFAWAPGASRKTVIRGGYALMYNAMPLNIPLLIWQSGPVSPLVSTITQAGSQIDLIQTSVPTSGTYPNAPLTLSDINRNVSGCSTFLQRITAPASPSTGVPLIDCSPEDTVASNLTAPRVQSYSLGVQRELGQNLMLEVDYYGNHGSRLYQRVDANPFGGWNDTPITEPGTNTTTTCLAGGGGFNCLRSRLNPDFGDITEVTNGGVSDYNAVEVLLTSREIRSRAGSFNLTASYTLSHMMDNASEIFGPGIRFIQGDFIGSLLSPETETTVEAITPFPQNSSDLKAEMANSSFDRRNRVSASGVWGLPSPRSRLAAAVAGGWEVSGISTYQSGQPYSALNAVPLGPCADANGDGILTNDRPNIGNVQAPVSSVALVDDSTCTSVNPATQHPYTTWNGQSIGPSPTGYIDLNGAPVNPASAHFVQVPLGTVGGGNAGRNTLLGPGIVDFDFALLKRFHLGERMTLEFRWEVYDALNRSNPGFLLGNVFASQAQPTPGFAFSPRATAAGITGVIPENALDALNSQGKHDFMTQSYMNTGNRTMQFGVHLIF
ncbi:MAG TPA: TonB-dependent receptor [Terriglobia bacterium]|nr:TonB-dependent receptor [Terriglobia bacterium]